MVRELPYDHHRTMPLWTKHGELRQFHVYVLSNYSMRLYIGVTNNLAARFREHVEKRIPGFTSRYHFDRVVNCESFEDIRDAIAREKQINGWVRQRKVELVTRVDPKREHLLPEEKI